MYQAIQTRYLAPGSVRGSRVKASAAAGSLTLGWDNALNSEANHAAAAKALADKFSWAGNFYGGVLADGSHVFVVSYPGAYAGDEPAFVVEAAA